MNRKFPLAIAILLSFSAVRADDDNDDDNDHDGTQFKAVMAGSQEVPSISTSGNGSFRAVVNEDGTSIDYELAYADLEGGAVTQAHIHIGQKHTNGSISAFLCSNLGNGPAGTQPCPQPPAIVTGTITAAEVIGPTSQGVSPGQLDELIEALNGGYAYANVHTATYPGGEIRSQLGHHRNRHGHRIGPKIGEERAGTAPVQATPEPAVRAPAREGQRQ